MIIIIMFVIFTWEASSRESRGSSNYTFNPVPICINY